MYRPPISFEVDFVASGYSRADDPELISLLATYQGLMERRIAQGMNPFLAFLQVYLRKSCPIKVAPGSYRLNLISDEELSLLVTSLSRDLSDFETGALQPLADRALSSPDGPGQYRRDMVSMVTVLHVLADRAQTQHDPALSQYCRLLLIRVNAWLAGIGSHTRMILKPLLTKTGTPK